MTKLIILLIFLLIVSIIVIYNRTKSNYEKNPTPPTHPTPPTPASTTPPVPKKNTCQTLGGKRGGAGGNCVFQNMDDCVKSLNCETDPHVANPDWYDPDKAKNYREVAKALNNGKMEIMDECTLKNTSKSSNPRCRIKVGENIGKVGVCLYEFGEVQECRPVGNDCKEKLDFCPEFYCDALTGKCSKQSLVCLEVEEGDTKKIVASCIH